MEQEPDINNVLYMDEYPELAKRVWLRRLARARQVGSEALGKIIELPEPPDDAA